MYILHSSVTIASCNSILFASSTEEQDEACVWTQGSEEEMREEIQARLPGTEWKARIGAAGTPMEQQRVSPIVELSMLLVQHPLYLLLGR